jgi:hypothetical protein
LYFMDTNGQNLSSIPVNGSIYASVVKAGDLLLVVPTKGSALLMALDQNGSTKWSFTPAK